MFDRRYVILPIVPLGVTSKTTFKVINDGYENLPIDFKIEDSMSDVKLKIVSDSDTLGVTT